MKKITYLIGAGASFNALPIVKFFPEELTKIINQLKIISGELSIRHNDEIQRKFAIAINDIEELAKGCNKHASVDTYAKMLFLKDDIIQYKKTKCSIILFFELYRFFKGAFDKRYDAFLASIMSKSEPKFPENINIISWNYDYEFEKAYLNYSKEEKNINEVYKELNIIHKNGSISDIKQQAFGIIKVNGTVGYFERELEIKLGLGQEKLFNSSYKTTYTAIMPLIETHVKKTEDLANANPAISFAWEDGDGYKQMTNAVQRVILETDVLVIIGYSFPYFNRIFDRQIFANIQLELKSCPIYVQDPNAANLIETITQLRLNWPFRTVKTIYPINNTDQFYIPHEL